MNSVEWQRAEAPLRLLDAALADFASRHNAVLTKNLKDWPERSLSWNGHLDKLIQVFLADELNLTFNVWLTVTQDRIGGRYWKEKYVVKERPVAEFLQDFPAMLLNSKVILDSWHEEDLEPAS